MFNFKYKIELNEHGRPIISPSKRTNKELDFIEHKFLGIELARTIITNTILSHEKSPLKYKLSEEDLLGLRSVKIDLEKIADIFATAIKGQMILMNEATELLNPQKYNVQVDTLYEMYNLNYHGIIYGDEIFKREEGLRVKVLSVNKIYELRGGIDNNKWIDVTGEN